MISKDRQYRSFAFETNEMTIHGRAIVFDQPTCLYEIDGVKYNEVIDSRALDNCQMDDVVLVINHEGKPAGRTRNNTLTLIRSKDGLDVQADLSRNATGRELHEDIKEGFLDRMSFSFTIGDASYDEKTRTRTIKAIKRLYDVSVVTFPAYEQTSVSARSFFEAEAEKERMEMRKLELQRRKAELMLKIESEE